MGWILRRQRALFNTYSIVAISAIILLSCWARSLAQEEAAWEFGAHRLVVSSRAVAPLMSEAFGEVGLRSMSVLARVGGVNLEGIASSDQSADGQLAVSYDATRPDGSRLEIKIGGATFYPPLPDWELKPIALLADSKYTADVSLFGDGPDQEHYFYISFNPALKDTLLGLRILQADIMLIDPEGLWSLPKLHGKTILGRGERTAVAATSLSAASLIKKALDQYPIQSWVLTDIGTAIKYKTANNQVTVSGNPFYYFWTTPSVSKLQELDKLTTQRDAITSPDDAAKLESKMIDLIKELRDSADTEEAPLELKKATAFMRDNQRLLADLNPAVWDAVSTTARYAAFFRHVKATNPAGWTAFMNQVKDLDIEPAVKTPTEWAKAR